MTRPIQVIKIGGNELSAPGFVERLASAVAVQQETFSCVVVHGGGRAINDLMHQLEVELEYKNGQRVTDEAVLEIAEMVLSGKVNKKLVLAFSEVGIEAIGLSGVDQRLLQVEPWGEEMDLVGRIVKVRTELFINYFEQGVLPVVSPISIGPAGRYNVNADHAAGMIAGSLAADQVVFISNVPGVMIDDQIASQLTSQETKTLIENDTITGGMIPKVNAALDSLKFGAGEARITDLSGLEEKSGTTIVMEEENND